MINNILYNKYKNWRRVIILFKNGKSKKIVDNLMIFIKNRK